METPAIPVSASPNLPAEVVEEKPSKVKCWTKKVKQFSSHHVGFLTVEQMFGLTRGRPKIAEPERRLMAAVLTDAIECYQKYALANDPRGRCLFEEAEVWITSEDRSWLFSFENICETLVFDPGLVRRQLGQWKERRAAEGRRFKDLVPQDADATTVAANAAKGPVNSVEETTADESEPFASGTDKNQRALRNFHEVEIDPGLSERRKQRADLVERLMTELDWWSLRIDDLMNGKLREDIRWTYDVSLDTIRALEDRNPPFLECTGPGSERVRCKPGRPKKMKSRKQTRVLRRRASNEAAVA